MTNPLGPTGRQIPDHSLELKDLPLSPGEGYLILPNSAGVVAWVQPLIDETTGGFILDNAGNIIYL